MAVGVKLMPIPEAWADWIKVLVMSGFGGLIYMLMVWTLNIANCRSLIKDFLSARTNKNSESISDPAAEISS